MNQTDKIQKKRQREQYIVAEMIKLYCDRNHGSKKELCQECKSLLDYAITRSEKCPFMEHKTFCSNCRVHCYKPELREKIRVVMRFSGPRMILVHPDICWNLKKRKKDRRRVKNFPSLLVKNVKIG